MNEKVWKNSKEYQINERQQRQDDGVIDLFQFVILLCFDRS